MRIPTHPVSSSGFLSGLALAALASTMLAPAMHAQSAFAGGGATSSGDVTSAPVNNSKPAWHETKIDKPITARVHRGVLTVDGLVTKVQLNYDIKGAGYLYFFVPGSGTAVVSLVQMSGSTLERGAFHGSTLSFSIGGHDFELTSDGPLMGKDKTDAYVRLDTTTASIARYPMMGFGSTTRAPYAWPGSAPEAKTAAEEEGVLQAPPLPRDLLPRVVGSVTTTSPASGKSDR